MPVHLQPLWIRAFGCSWSVVGSVEAAGFVGGCFGAVLGQLCFHGNYIFAFWRRCYSSKCKYFSFLLQ